MIDQTIKTGGKLKLQAAAAQKALDNARLALAGAQRPGHPGPQRLFRSARRQGNRPRRPGLWPISPMRSISTRKTCWSTGSPPPTIPPSCAPRPGRPGWPTTRPFKPTFTPGSSSSPPWACASLRCTEVAGRIDAFIPYYDYDKDAGPRPTAQLEVFTARNGIDAAKYNLKLAQITPWFPDVDFQVGLFKDFAVPPQRHHATVQVGVPIPIWDQNKGNIRSAEAALVRALEEPHRVEVTLTTAWPRPTPTTRTTSPRWSTTAKTFCRTRSRFPRRG